MAGGIQAMTNALEEPQRDPSKAVTRSALVLFLISFSF